MKTVDFTRLTSLLILFFITFFLSPFAQTVMSKITEFRAVEEYLKFSCNDSKNKHCIDSTKRLILQNLCWSTIARENCNELNAHILF